MAKKQVLIVCGEASGDLNASQLAQSLKRLEPEIEISAVGGALLRQAGANIIYDIKDIACLGFFDIVKQLPKFIALKKLLLEKISIQKFDLVILVDFSGFNLRLAKALNKSIPIIYYVSPQVWASREGRVKSIKEYISRMIVLFKFEEEFYKRHGIDATFVGHPLLDIVKPAMEKAEFQRKFNISGSRPVIALLPGSRIQEIKHILPVMLGASVLISKQIPGIQFVIAKSTQVDLGIYQRIINGFDLDLKIVEGKTYDCLDIARFCLVASGTATLETAIMQKPFAVIYKMGLLNYLLYRPQVKVPYIGMVNIVADKKIVPEFIQFNATPQKISEEVISFLENPSSAERMRNELRQIKSLLGVPGAGLRASQIIVDFLNRK